MKSKHTLILLSSLTEFTSSGRGSSKTINHMIDNKVKKHAMGETGHRRRKC
jgi:hypothetical protein